MMCTVYKSVFSLKRSTMACVLFEFLVRSFSKTLNNDCVLLKFLQLVFSKTLNNGPCNFFSFYSP
jgi:hypothetical protein